MASFCRLLPLSIDVWIQNAKIFIDYHSLLRAERPQLAYFVEKLVCEMRDFVARILMRGLRFG